MKKTTYILLAVSLLAAVAVFVMWGQTTPDPAVVPVQEQAATVPAVTPPAQTAAQPNVASVHDEVVPQVVQTPSAVPAAQKPVTPAATVPATTTQTGAPDDLRNAMQGGEFLSALTFTLTEAQMVEFARASAKVAKINSKWDVEIASAETDAMAIEYNNLAVEEIQFSLKNIPGLTLDQYNELTKLTATSPEFNAIYLAYKQLVNEGAFGKAGTNIAPPPSATQTTPAVSTQAVAAPAVPAVAVPTAAPAPVSSAVPANSGTVATPPGSPTPPYSPPATR